MPKFCLEKADIINMLTFVYNDRVVCKLFTQTKVLNDTNVNAKVTTILGSTENYQLTTDADGFISFVTPKLV